MHAGIPGIGLGGLFFVLSALLMLAVELVNTARGRSSVARWRLVARQSGLAAGIVIATAIMLWLLDLLLLGSFSDPQAGPPAQPGPEANTGTGDAVLRTLSLLPVSAAPILATFTLLVLVLCLSETLRWFVRRPAPPHRYRDHNRSRRP